jgi:hypothetical protein
MGEEVQEVAKRDADVKQRSARSHLDLLEQLGAATEELRAEIEQLQTMPRTPASAASIFRGFAVLERYYRLLGELLGEISPPQTNVYLTKIDALLASSVDPVRFSPSLQAALKEAEP